MRERISMEDLPDEMLTKVLEIGVENSILGCADVCSFSICCKHSNKLANDDTLWSHLLTLDFPQNQTSSSSSQSSSKKNLYKYRLERHIKHRLDSLLRKVHKDLYRTGRSVKRIERHVRGIEAIDDQIDEAYLKLLDLINHRNLLHPDPLVETAERNLQDLTTRNVKIEPWVQGIALNGQAPPLASVAPSSSTPAGSSSSSGALVYLETEIYRLRFLHEGFRSTFEQHRHQIDTLLRRLQECFKQRAVLLSRLASFGTCSHPSAADDHDDDYDGVDEEEDTEDDDGDNDDDADAAEDDDDDDSEATEDENNAEDASDGSD